MTMDGTRLNGLGSGVLPPNFGSSPSHVLKVARVCISASALCLWGDINSQVSDGMNVCNKTLSCSHVNSNELYWLEKTYVYIAKASIKKKRK